MRAGLIKTLCLLTTAVLSLGLTGCGGDSTRESEPTTPVEQAEAVPAPKPPDRAPAASLQDTAQGVVKAAEETAAKVQASAVEAAEKAQALLEQARGLLQEKKVQEASGLLNQLGGMTLETEQRETLASLTTEVQKLYGEVESGLGELKTLVEKEQYAEATALVSKLGDYEFSPEQQKLYDGLKVQVQKLMESQAGQEAAKAVGNLLGR